MKSSDKKWSTGEGNGNPFQYPNNQYEKAKKEKIMTLKDEPPRFEVSNMLLGKSGRQLLIDPERMKQLNQSGSTTQLRMCLIQ